jgi:indole-3-glycerol phosphate synthase
MDAKEPSEFLGRIVHAKRLELTASRLRVPQTELEKSVQQRSPGIFRQSLLGRNDEQAECAIIAEVKKASPSRGVLCQDFRPAEIARGYRKAGARALSVLTDAPFFQGALEDLKLAKAASSLPVLRKDFTLAEYHLYEAAAAGADAVLLIVAILGPADLARFIVLAGELGLDALVEVHNADELVAAIDAGAKMIGVNNRDLRTFEVTLETSLRLADSIPDDAVAISESGLRTADDLRRLRSAGFDAFLIGERFMTEKDPGAALERLLADVAATAALG